MITRVSTNRTWFHGHVDFDSMWTSQYQCSVHPECKIHVTYHAEEEGTFEVVALPCGCKKEE